MFRTSYRPSEDKEENNYKIVSVYGPFKKLHYNDWEESDLHSQILQAFINMDITLMNPIQKCSFLYLMKNCNIAMIGFLKGKSLAYLTCLFSKIMDNKYKNIKTVGPIAIVLTNSLRSCCALELLGSQLNYYARTKNKVNVVVADASTPVCDVQSSLSRRCDILITTPISLNDLIKHSKLFSWVNLSHFIFDNLDVLLENFKDEVHGFSEILRKKREKRDNVQFISTSVRWTKDVDEFLKRLFVSWQYTFGSPLEAARYIKVGLDVVLVKNDKLEKILEYLKNNIKYGRSILITSSPVELRTIYNYFQSNDSDIEVLLANQLKYVTVQEWKNSLKKSQRLLICSDVMLLDYYLSDADCLIHYDIPINEYEFSFRFSVLQDSVPRFTEKKRSAHIFLSESSRDMLQLPKIVNLMKEFGNSNLDPILLKNVEMINDTLEKSKINSLFCNQVQQFGFCPNHSSCRYRHVLLKEIDAPIDNIPKSGSAVIKILNVYDATHMSVKILKQSDAVNPNNDMIWLDVKDFSTTIKQELSLLYSKPIHKIIFENPKPRDIVGVQLVVKFGKMRYYEYYRATVIDLIGSNYMNSHIKVKLIDKGCIKFVSRRKIFVLPEKFQKMQNSTVDMYVSSVKPVDFDKVWCDKANNMVKELKYGPYTFIVTVKLALGSTIWVDKVHKKCWNSKLKTYDLVTVLPNLLLSSGYAASNSEHLGKLTELSTSADI